MASKGHQANDFEVSDDDPDNEIQDLHLISLDEKQNQSSPMKQNKENLNNFKQNLMQKLGAKVDPESKFKSPQKDTTATNSNLTSS